MSHRSKRWSATRTQLVSQPHHKSYLSRSFNILHFSNSQCFLHRYPLWFYYKWTFSWQIWQKNHHYLWSNHATSYSCSIFYGWFFAPNVRSKTALWILFRIYYSSHNQHVCIGNSLSISRKRNFANKFLYVNRKVIRRGFRVHIYQK